MSELKVYCDLTSYIADYGHPLEVYDKSKADKVIAELKEGAKNLILDNYLKDKKLTHHKYKRCLAMAKWCKSNALYYEQRIDKCWNDGYASMHKEFYQRWHKRWLELAKKFKEVK